MKNVVTAILGGGQGTRLWPLTSYRAKPAVPVAGKFRLIDIPISNSLHAGIDRIFVLTQFNSSSLHRHIAQTYRFDNFTRGFVNILAAHQSLSSATWYQGTADAVRQNLDRLLAGDPSEVLILSGDQLYLMDLEGFVEHHREREADITIAVKPVSREEARGFGIMRLDRAGRIVEFVEKPKDERILDELTLDAETIGRLELDAKPGQLLASMGIYCFRNATLRDSLEADPSQDDFGGEVIPSAIGRLEVHAWLYNGYWRDIGTIPAFHEANLELAEPNPPLNLYQVDRPIFTHARFLPGTKVHGCEISTSLISEGCVLGAKRIHRSVIGIRSQVAKGSVVEESILMGTSPEQRSQPGEAVGLGIGRDCVIRRAIVDRGARVGDGCRLVNEAGVDEADADDWCIRGGIIVVRAEAVIPPGTVV